MRIVLAMRGTDVALTAGGAPEDPPLLAAAEVIHPKFVP